MNLTDGEVLSSKCSDIFIDCERLDAVRIVSGQLSSARQNDLFCTREAISLTGWERRQLGGYFARVRKDSVALRDGLPVRPRAQLAGFAGCRRIRLITRSGRYRVA